MRLLNPLFALFEASTDLQLARRVIISNPTASPNGQRREGYFYGGFRALHRMEVMKEARLPA